MRPYARTADQLQGSCNELGITRRSTAVGQHEDIFKAHARQLVGVGRSGHAHLHTDVGVQRGADDPAQPSSERFTDTKSGDRFRAQIPTRGLKRDRLYPLAARLRLTNGQTARITTQVGTC